MAAHQRHLAHSHVLLGPNCVLKIENKKSILPKKIQIPSCSLESRRLVTQSPHSYMSTVSAVVWNWVGAA